MGGELPVAINILSKYKTEKIGEVSGYSYFLDTIGGVAGAISAGFIMIPLFGSITNRPHRRNPECNRSSECGAVHDILSEF